MASRVYQVNSTWSEWVAVTIDSAYRNGIPTSRPRESKQYPILQQIKHACITVWPKTHANSTKYYIPWNSWIRQHVPSTFSVAVAILRSSKSISGFKTSEAVTLKDWLFRLLEGSLLTPVTNTHCIFCCTALHIAAILSKLESSQTFHSCYLWKSKNCKHSEQCYSWVIE